MLERADGTTQIALLTPSSTSFTVEASPGVAVVMRAYLKLGIAHILFGVDHLLFVLALIVLAGGGNASSDHWLPGGRSNASRLSTSVRAKGTHS